MAGLTQPDYFERIPIVTVMALQLPLDGAPLATITT
jgi:hypothetical protein